MRRRLCTTLVLLAAGAAAQSPTVTPTAAATATRTGTASATTTASSTAPATSTASSTATPTPTKTGTPTSTPTKTGTPSSTPTRTASPTVTPTGTPSRTATRTLTQTATPGGDLFTGFTAAAYLNTLAGTGVAANGASVGGVAGTSVALDPWGLAHDATAGRLYFSQSPYHAIKYVDLASHKVHTWVGSTTNAAGSRDGALTAATFNAPRGLSLEPLSGDVFVADFSNTCVRRVHANGTVARWAGVCASAGSSMGETHPQSRARMGRTYDVLVLSASQQLVCDYDSHLVRLVQSNATGRFLLPFAGSGLAAASNADFVDAPYLTAKINHPTAITRSPTSGIIYIAAQYRIVTLRNGVVSTILGAWNNAYTGDGGLAKAATMNYMVNGLAVDNAGNQLLISDSIQHVVRFILTNGTLMRFAGRAATLGNSDNVLVGSGLLHTPRGIVTTPSGDVYVATYTRIKLISYATPTRTPSPSAGFTPSRTPTQTATVTRGITRATASVEMPFVFSYAGTQRSFGYAGDGRAVSGSGVKLAPWGLAIDSVRRVMYVSSYGGTSNSVIRAINMTTGVIRTYAGTGAYGSKDGPRLKSTWGFPRGMAVDPATGDLAVADQYRSTVRVVYANGTVLRRAGIDGVNGWNGDGGLGTNTMLGWPHDVAYRRSTGSFLFTDYLRHIVRELFPNGTVRAWAGKYGGALFSRSSPQHRLQGRFLFPMAIAVADASQTVFVSGRGGEFLTGDQYWMIWRVVGDTVSQLVGQGQQGVLTTSFLTPDGLPATSTGVTFVWGMAVDPAGRLVYADRK